MTFHEPKKKTPLLGIVILGIFIALALALFFSLKTCKSTGFLRSAKSSDANYLYQVYPASYNGTEYFISLEGVFKTSIYERKGGITMRSGSTELRLTLHNLATGELVAREVIGNYPEEYSGIIGAKNNIFWMYNSENGIHGRKIPELDIAITQADLITANSELSEGLAMTQNNLSNINELYAFDREHNALMLTTISGKNIWIDGTTFKTIEAPVAYLTKSNYNDIINNTIKQAQAGQTININQITDQIIQATTGIGNVFEFNHLANQIVAFDSCTYQLNGKTIRTITKTDCPQPIPSSNQSALGTQYIEPNILSAPNPENMSAVNPLFIYPEMSIIMHAKTMGDKSELLISGINNKTLNKIFTIPSGIIMSNHRVSYNINAAFGVEDTLWLGIDNQLFSINIKTGKLIWKKVIAKNDYNAKLLAVGEASQNGKRFIIVANSYFTVLNKQGIFINGRTDYQQMVLDAATGKILKQTEVNNSKPETLPCYLGMINDQAWFYSSELGLHSRLLPNLAIQENNFSQILKSGNITSPIVKTTGYDKALEEKYIAIDTRKKIYYFTTENGLHYAYDLSSKKVSEINAPDDKLYENLKLQNKSLNNYYQNPYHSSPNEIRLIDGDKLKIENTNGIRKLTHIAAIKEADIQVTTGGNQFIEGQFLINSISLNKDIYYTDERYNPVSTNNKVPLCYILHKNKIAPDAHRIISKYNYESEKTVWQFDATAMLGVDGEITRIYTRKSSLVIIFKTHPDLDDNFTCASLNADTGKLEWVYTF